MEVGIMGLAGSGKTTLFNLLTGIDASPQGGHRGATQVGIARVPDARLDRLSELYNPEKTTPATIRYIDVPGLPEEHRRDNAFNVPELRGADALMVVLRAFENDAVAHPLVEIDPLRDLRHIEDEFILQDQMVVERRLDRPVARTVTANPPGRGDPKAAEREGQSTLDKIVRSFHNSSPALVAPGSMSTSLHTYSPSGNGA